MAEKVADTVKKAVQAVVTPGFNDLKTEVKVIGTKLDATNTRIDELDKRMNIRFDAVGAQFESVKEMIRDQNEKFDMAREVAVLKAKVAELEKRK